MADTIVSCIDKIRALFSIEYDQVINERRLCNRATTATATATATDTGSGGGGGGGVALFLVQFMIIAGSRIQS